MGTDYKMGSGDRINFFFGYAMTLYHPEKNHIVVSASKHLVVAAFVMNDSINKREK